MSDPTYAWQLHDIPLLEWPAAVLARFNNPPTHTNTNDSYIVATNPTGEWIDYVNHIATWSSEGRWVYQAPTRGRRVYVHSVRDHYEFTGTEWAPVETGSLPPGGLTGYVLKKLSDADGDADWQAIASGGGGAGGFTNIILRDRFEVIEGGLPEGSLVVTLGHGFGAYYERGAVYERIGEYGLTYRGSISQRGIPEGGTSGQVLAKTSNSDFAVAWVAPEEGAGGDITTVTAGIGLSGGGSSGDVTLNVVYGTTNTSACVGNDTRLSNDRTASGLRTTSGIVSVSAASAPTVGQVLRATSDSTATWQDIEDAIGDGDITAVIAGTGLTGGATSGPATLSVSFGNGAGQACEGTDSRLSDDRVANAIRTTSGTVTVSTSAAPSSGQALIATGPTTAEWQDISGGGGSGDITAVVAGTGLTGGATSGSATLAVDFGTGANQVRHANDAAYTNSRAPTGSASGDLGGSYPGPTVTAVHTGGTQLTIGSISDGQYVQRSGTTLVGVSGSSAPQPVQVNGSLVGTRDAIDLVAGNNISISGTDDTGNNRVRVTIHSVSSADITGVSAGLGLTGGGTSGDVSLAVAFGTGANQVRHGNDAAFADARTPTGDAGGDLDGTYPNPTVTAIHSSSTQLTIGAIGDGEFLQRSGSTIVSAAGASAPQPVQVDGTLIGTRDAIDIVAGTGISLSGSDDSANNRVRVTINNTSTADITSVTAGNGLTGGGTSGDVTLAVAFGTGTNQSRHGNDAAYTDDRTASGIRTASSVVALSSATAPSAGQFLRATSSTTASWQGLTFGDDAGEVCEGDDPRLSDDRTATGLRTASGIVVISAATAPSSGQVLTATSSTTATWQDPPVGEEGTGDITSVIAGDGLTGGASAGAATLAVDFGTGATQVRPGNDATYTNDRTASGLRTASTVVSISSAVAPTAGYVLTALSETEAEWQEPAGGSSEPSTATLVPYHEIWSTADSWDFEARTAESADLATLGWTVRLFDSPFTVLTRAGNIDITSAPSAGTYRSTIAHGTMFVQFPSGVLVTIHKATSGAYTYKSRAWCPSAGSASTSISYAFVSAGNDGTPDVYKNLYLGGHEFTSTREWSYSSTGSQTTHHSFTNNNPVLNDLIKYIHDPNDATSKGMRMVLGYTGIEATTATSRSLTFTTLRAGIMLRHPAGQFAHIDFIRRTPLYQLP